LNNHHNQIKKQAENFRKIQENLEYQTSEKNNLFLVISEKDKEISKLREELSFQHIAAEHLTESWELEKQQNLSEISQLKEDQKKKELKKMADSFKLRLSEKELEQEQIINGLIVDSRKKEKKKF